MRLPFGLEITRRRKGSPPFSNVSDNRGGWWPWIGEPYAGAWQKNQEWTTDTVLAHHAVYACVTLIANDVGKLRAKFMQQGPDEIWKEISSPAFSPVLRRPNRYQNHIQFKQWWQACKLIRGNTYVLKVRDQRKVVTGLYLLDPSRVQVLVAPDGSVYYQLQSDNLSGLQEASVTVPASEIIHDRMNCLFHPLVGVSPIFASGLAANVGLNIEENSSSFFAKGSNPSGVLTAPGKIDQTTADRLAAHWNSQFQGDRSGRVAVLGDGLEWTPLRMSALDSQLIEQLQWSAETVCSAFHVPPFKVGLGTMPTYNNGELLNQVYYSDCLQAHIESWELCMDEGLGLTDSKDGKVYGVELDLDALLRMDTATQIEALGKGVGAGIHAPNEARKKLDLPPVKGGETPYLQQQNYSLAALDERDRNNPAPSNQRTGDRRTPPPEPPDPSENGDATRAAFLWERDTADIERELLGVTP